jgi:hypothetical protein
MFIFLCLPSASLFVECLTLSSFDATRRLACSSETTIDGNGSPWKDHGEASEIGRSSMVARAIH